MLPLLVALFFRVSDYSPALSWACVLQGVHTGWYWLVCEGFHDPGGVSFVRLVFFFVGIATPMLLGRTPACDGAVDDWG